MYTSFAEPIGNIVLRCLFYLCRNSSPYLSWQICYDICGEHLPGFVYFGTQWGIEVSAKLGYNSVHRSTTCTQSQFVDLLPTAVYLSGWDIKPCSPTTETSSSSLLEKQCFCSITLRDEVSFDPEHDGCNYTCGGNYEEICGRLKICFCWRQIPWLVRL